MYQNASKSLIKMYQNRSKRIKKYQNGSKCIKKYQNTSNVSKGDCKIIFFIFWPLMISPWGLEFYNSIPVLGAVKNYKCSHLFFHISISLFGPAYIFVLKNSWPHNPDSYLVAATCVTPRCCWELRKNLRYDYGGLSIKHAQWPATMPDKKKSNWNMLTLMTTQKQWEQGHA